MITAATAPAASSTGAADRVSQPVGPTARVFLQHGRSSLDSSKPCPRGNGDILKDGGQTPTSTAASSSDGFLSPRTGTIPQPVQCSTFPQVEPPTAVSWHMTPCRLIHSGRPSSRDSLIYIKEAGCDLVIPSRIQVGTAAEMANPEAS